MAMVRAAQVSKKDIVLEIGPGKGSLTELLAQRAKKVIAIEKDRDLIPLLEEKFATTPNVEIIEGDVLNYKLPTKNYKLVSNIPYYLTGRLIRLFLESPRRPSVMVLIIQREVAERIMGKINPSTKLGVKESLLSISVKAYGSPKIIRIVPRGAFNPPPSVDSAIIAIEHISDAWFIKNSIKPADFFAMLRKAFQNKRKMLKNSLPTCMLNTECSTKRPEELSLEDWATLLNTRCSTS